MFQPFFYWNNKTSNRKSNPTKRLPNKGCVCSDFLDSFHQLLPLDFSIRFGVLHLLYRRHICYATATVSRLSMYWLNFHISMYGVKSKPTKCSESDNAMLSNPLESFVDVAHGTTNEAVDAECYAANCCLSEWFLFCIQYASYTIWGKTHGEFSHSRIQIGM